MQLSAVLQHPQMNPNVAWSNSWFNVINDQGVPLFAQATYLTNISDINDLLTALINELRQEPNKNGFDFVDDTSVYSGNYECLKVVANCKFAGLTADNTDIGNLSSYELPQGFEITGEIYDLQLQYGAVIAYKAVDINRYTNSILNFAGKELISLRNGEGIVTIQG
jgi:hypothetical protein